MVLDRLFLWIFSVAVLVGTCGIILHAPTLYDTREPIDMMMSEVAIATFHHYKGGSRWNIVQDPWKEVLFRKHSNLQYSEYRPIKDVLQTTSKAFDWIFANLFLTCVRSAILLQYFSDFIEISRSQSLEGSDFDIFIKIRIYFINIGCRKDMKVSVNHLCN